MGVRTTKFLVMARLNTLTPDTIAREYITSRTYTGIDNKAAAAALAADGLKIRTVTTDRVTGSVIIRTGNKADEIGGFVDWARKHLPKLRCIMDHSDNIVFMRTII